jgi:hypothetical protein
MKKYLLITVALALALGVVLMGGQISPVTAKEPKILEFDTMIGVPPALTGTQAPIRGINGGGLPWTIGPSSGELKADGKLEINVQGLVFAAGPNTGKNTVANFRAIVSCLRSDGSTENLVTDPFPATQGFAADGGGNASIEVELDLPETCIAPLIFVTSPGGAWFATTGQ